MNCRLEHIAIYCKDVKSSTESYQKLFGGKVTETRTGAAGYPFCFLQINEETAIQFCESEDQIGLHHYGFVTDNVEQAAREFLAKGAKITRESRDAAGRLTAVFLRDPSGLEVEIR